MPFGPVGGQALPSGSASGGDGDGIAWIGAGRGFGGAEAGITGAYHLGYEQFREDGIGPPEFGNTVISVPMLATGNPLGSVLAHASMHVTADVHGYETDVFLPPQTDAP